MIIGAKYSGKNGSSFTVWSPHAESMSLKLINMDRKIYSMEKDESDYWNVYVKEAGPGTNYKFLINGVDDRPDPASNYQPEGVHGPSQVVDHHAFKWEDGNWQNPSLEDYIIYEMHIGSFTGEGTFESIIPRLQYLKELGVTMIEIMPVAQFPGTRNWGYDGVYHYAPQNSYGGYTGLKKLVNECHKMNLGVILDVVYNHFGPEGNYIQEYGPYFNSRYKTPWGDAINYDDEYSDQVRNFFIQNALYWFENFHFDALRLDAIHSIYDMSAKHFLSELKEKVEEFSGKDRRRRYLIAESDLNDVKVVSSSDRGGYNMDAQWSDDFHHSMHSFFTKETDGYYIDFGGIDQVFKSLKNTFVNSGNYSRFRKRKYGNSAVENPSSQFLIFLQNHDQVGNRAFGSRLSALIEFEELKLCSGTLLLSPYIPMIFMGEEYMEQSPFLYFVSHSDKNLIESVRKGRQEEFKSFDWNDEIPDPQSPDTFEQSVLKWDFSRGRNKSLLNFYKKLITLRKSIPSLKKLSRDDYKVDLVNDEVIIIERRNGREKIKGIYNFSNEDRETNPVSEGGTWKRLIDSSSEEWCGPGELTPEKITAGVKINMRKFSFAIYQLENI